MCNAKLLIFTRGKLLESTVTFATECVMLKVEYCS